MTEIREALSRTGILYTHDISEPGHVSKFWHKRIGEFCDFVEKLPLDAAKRLEAEKHIHNEARNALAYVDRRLRIANERIRALEEELAPKRERDNFVRQLVEDALPRMRSLNNQMSPGWVARAEKFLGE